MTQCKMVPKDLVLHAVLSGENPGNKSDDMDLYFTAVLPRQSCEIIPPRYAGLNDKIGPSQTTVLHFLRSPQ